MEALRGFYDSSEQITRGEFASFVAPYFESVYGIHTLQWIPLVPAAGRADFTKAAREDGLSSFEFFESAVPFARDNNILISHDAAYSSNTYDGYKAPSILQVDGATDVAVEFYSLSKAFSMTGEHNQRRTNNQRYWGTHFNRSFRKMQLLRSN